MTNLKEKLGGVVTMLEEQDLIREKIYELRQSLVERDRIIKAELINQGMYEFLKPDIALIRRTYHRHNRSDM